MAIFASRADIRARLRSRRFWLRLLAGMGLGHVFGALAVAGTVALFLVLLLVSAIPSTASMLGGLALATRVDTILFGLLTLSLWALLAMAPLTALTSPLTIAMALVLKTGRGATALLGSMVGLFVGWPVALAVYGSDLGDPIMVVSAAAGAMFGFALWQQCIRHELPPSDLAGPQLARWWPTHSLLERAIIISALLIIVAALSVEFVGPGGPHRRPLNIWSRLVTDDR